jgi:ABC-type nitrate/sulfonate/bicarbonate transport system ATPase subunit
MTVRRNVEFGLPPSNANQRPSVDKWLSLTGIQRLTDRFPASLSGGQRQRVQIARALASQRRLILLDEPFSALDAINRQVLIPAIRSLLENAGRTCVLVTHDIRDAIRFADRVCVISDKNHNVAAIIPVDRNEVDGRESEQAVAQNFDKIWSVLKGSDTTKRNERRYNE